MGRLPLPLPPVGKRPWSWRDPSIIWLYMTGKKPSVRCPRATAKNSTQGKPLTPQLVRPCFKLIQFLGSVCCLEPLEVPRFPARSCLRIVLYSVHRPTRNMPYFTITGTPIVAYRTFYSLWNEFVQLSAGCLLSMVSCFFRIGRRMILSVTV